jgi:AcrR family transcriptional regulator
MRTVDPEKHRTRRTHIIESALVLFASKGFADTTTADICRAAGVSTGSLFHYFPSKQAVFYGIWELDRTEWDEVMAAAEADPDHWAALMAIALGRGYPEPDVQPIVRGLGLPGGHAGAGPWDQRLVRLDIRGRAQRVEHRGTHRACRTAVPLPRTYSVAPPGGAAC